MNKLQNLFVVLVNTDIFQMTLKLGVLSLETLKHIFVYADMQNVWRYMQCLHHLNYY